MASFPTIAMIPVICLTLLAGRFYLAQATNNGAAKQVDDGVSSSVGDQRVFDYFMLAQQWPPTYCRNTHSCCPQNGCCRGANSPTQFTIHGLWTNYNDGAWPSCCNGPEFDANEISILFDALNKYWPTLSCSNSSTCHGGKGLFWGHEWETHGTCSFPIFRDEYSYFLATLNLYFKYNVTEVLIEAGYLPSDSEKYPLGGISSAIQNAYHSTPEITCSGNAIVEVRLCFYKDFKPRDCDATSSLDSSCTEYVSLPTYASIGLTNIGTTMPWGSGKSSV